MPRLEQLCKDFPELYKDIYFECDDGWYEPLRKLSEKIIAHCKGKPLPKVQQVKEKFGGLRYYIDYAKDAHIGRLIQEAERECSTTCEVCGKDGTTEISPSGWYRTRCERHAKPYRQDENLF